MVIPVQTKNDLDRASCSGCGNPACKGGLFFHANCHPESALIVHYLDGVLWLYCSTCKQPVVPIAVHPGKAPKFEGASTPLSNL